MKNFLLIISVFLLSTLNASQIQPTKVIKTDNNVISASVTQNMLFASTDNGVVEIFNLSSNSKLKTIKLPQIKINFGEEFSNPRIINADSINGKDIVIVSEDAEAGKALFVYKNEKLEQIFSYKDRLNISKAYFVSDTQIILGTLGNEIKLYDLEKKAFIYSVQPYWSMLTDFKLSKDRAFAFSAAESGVIYMYEVSSGKKLNEFSAHTDISLGVDFANGIIISGGADRKCALITTSNSKTYHLNTDFPIYAVALSKSGKLGAFVSNEKNDISVFDTNSQEIKYTLTGSPNHRKINTIVFLDENRILSSSSGKEILIWSIK